MYDLEKRQSARRRVECAPASYGRADLRNWGLNPHIPKLLNLDLGSDFLELLLDGLGLVLRDPFLDRLRGALDEVLGFLQTEAGHFADHLDHVDLVAADFRQRRGELGLLFSLLGG